MTLLNAFSINMLTSFPSQVTIDEISLEQARELALTGLVSAVGHTETACVFSDVLRVTIATNRATIRLESGNTALVGQYVGPRLPEGTTTLPEGATIRWFRVTIK